MKQRRLQGKRTRYQAKRVRCLYRTNDPENRLLAHTRGAEWEHGLVELVDDEAEQTRRQNQRPAFLTDEQRNRFSSLGGDPVRVREASIAAEAARKERFWTVLGKVTIAVDRETRNVPLTIASGGRAASQIDLPLKTYRPPTIPTTRTQSNLSVASPFIAPMPSSQASPTGRACPQPTGTASPPTRPAICAATGRSPRFDPSTDHQEWELVTHNKPSEILGQAPSTLHRWFADGFIAGKQLPPRALWRIRVTDELRAHFVEQAPQGYAPMQEPTRLLGVSRHGVLQRVNRGELRTRHLRPGKWKCLQIKLLGIRLSLYDNLP